MSLRNPLMDVNLGQRGNRLFTPEQLHDIIQKVVVPELDDQTTVVGVGSFTSAGAQAALVFRKKMKLGEWRLEAAFEHDWATHQDQVGGRVLFKL